jgi:hypothetical protein
MIKRPTTVDPEEMVSTYENFPKMTYRGHRWPKSWSRRGGSQWEETNQESE